MNKLIIKKYTKELIDYVKGGDVAFNVVTKSIKPTTRKLKVTWSPMLKEDIKVFHGIDAEKEIINVFADEIAKSIDSEIFSSWRVTNE